MAVFRFTQHLVGRCHDVCVCALARVCVSSACLRGHVPPLSADATKVMSWQHLYERGVEKTAGQNGQPKHAYNARTMGCDVDQKWDLDGARDIRDAGGGGEGYR